ncbi:PREDICTED: putative UDP-rhamnose:rhamnosyltransferase 1 [Ipomoea nil]|uniref:putative UDP-rhamnose:rhamnosyltransferase 1 n=1 Tax=Ipomoea nil TaxID=35883 RepID=UPI000901A450|nr:PREDICTED: putative UDP-rhamnose:rhamnosyltransferase 1 [Ipomoea nil]XP_019177373.1 PREDICTED: putative UDP-rhamnose:rhamnosyltransferase 1 [Ipomoea nil]
MASERSTLHIVMLPWLAFGHIIPYLELAKLLAERGNKISFVSTPRNIQRLPKLHPHLVPNIDLIGLPLPQVENLPEDAESTFDLPYDKVRYLKIAFDELQDSMAAFLQTLSPDWVIHDFASFRLVPIMEKLSIPSVYFSIFTASTVSNFCLQSPVIDGEDYPVEPRWVPFETTIMPRYFEIKRVCIDGGNVSDLYRLAVTVKGASAMFVRSCYELEPEWLQLAEDLVGKPTIPVGLLPTTAYDDEEDDDKKAAWLDIKEWLDKQEKGSVVYVAFGSETKPNQEQVVEIALGLELSQLPFFWVYRNQRGSADAEVTKLPEGFEERTRGRGVICTSWAPQLKILSHDSVGGFLTHSGWSSVVEALKFEKKLIMRPFLRDQGIITRLLVEKEMGYAIARDENGGSFSRDSVADSLRVVMVEEHGKVFAEKVKKMKAKLFEKEKQDNYVNKLLDYLHAASTIHHPSGSHKN